MASPLRALPDQQLGFDETLIEDVELEQALEERQRCKQVASDVRKEYDAANEAANAEIAKQELPDGNARPPAGPRRHRAAAASDLPDTATEEAPR